MTADRQFLDTNVLVYAYDAAEPAKRVIAQDLLLTETPFALSAPVLGEFFVTVTPKLAEPLYAEYAEYAREVVAALAEIPTLPISDALVRAAIGRVECSRLSYWDYLIVEASIATGCSVLLTEDLQDGQIIDDVRITNPFDGAV